MAMFHLAVASLFTYIFSKQDLHRCPPSYTHTHTQKKAPFYHWRYRKSTDVNKNINDSVGVLLRCDSEWASEHAPCSGPNAGSPTLMPFLMLNSENCHGKTIVHVVWTHGIHFVKGLFGTTCNWTLIDPNVCKHLNCENVSNSDFRIRKYKSRELKCHCLLSLASSKLLCFM